MSQLPRYRRRKLPNFGPAAQRKRPVRRVEYEAVARRAQGRCEMCHEAQDPLDPHHTFGRGHLPGIPAEVCETRELILGVCRKCHDLITDGDQERSDAARWVACHRFGLKHGLDVPVYARSGERLVDLMRKLVRDAAEADIAPEAEAELKREREAGGNV